MGHCKANELHGAVCGFVCLRFDIPVACNGQFKPKTVLGVHSSRSLNIVFTRRCCLLLVVHVPPATVIGRHINSPRRQLRPLAPIQAPRGAVVYARIETTYLASSSFFA